MRLRRFASSRCRGGRDGNGEKRKREKRRCADALLVIECDGTSRLAQVRFKSGNPPSYAHVRFISFLNDVVERRLIGRCVVLSHRTCMFAYLE